MSSEVSVSLLEPVVLLDVMEVVSPDDECPLHLGALHHTRQDTTTDTHVPREGTLLIDVGTLTCLMETQQIMYLE